MKQVYSKFSNDRDEKFQIQTSICIDDDGTRFVLKRPVSDSGSQHIQKMVNHYHKLAHDYKGTIFEPNRCEQYLDGVKFEFLEYMSLEKQLDIYFQENDIFSLVKAIKRFKENIYAIPSNIEFEYTSEFEDVFGTNTSFNNTLSLRTSNIDMIFSNILLGEKWYVLDYEWMFDFPVPIDFIFFRALYYYISGNTKREVLHNYNLMNLFGIDDDKYNMFMEMENNFQKYVIGNKHSLALNKKLLLKNKVNVLEAGKSKYSNYVQLYFDFGSGFNEANSIKIDYSDLYETININYPIDKKVKRLRIDPGSKPMILNDYLFALDNMQVSDFNTNGYCINNSILFANDDPWIELGNISGDLLSISFNQSILSIASEKTISNVIARIIEDNQTINNLNTDINNKDIIIQSQQAYIDNIRSYFIFRLLSIVKRTLRSFKHRGLKYTLHIGASKIKNKAFKKNKARIFDLPSNKHAEVFEKKDKVLVVVHEAQKAGATLLSLNIINTLIEHTSFEPVILLISGGPLRDEFVHLGKLYELNQPDFTQVHDEKLLEQYVSEICESNIRYAICNSVVTGIVLPLLEKNNIKTVTLVHELSTSINNYNFVYAAKCVQKYSDHIIFAANYVKEDYIKQFYVDDDKCHILPQGVYSTYNSSSKEENTHYKKKLCKELGIPETSQIILGAGYGNFRKGLDWFASVAIEDAKENPTHHYVWLGNKDEEFAVWINNDFENVGINNFHWMAYKSDPSYVFGGTDIFFLSSREDPFPSVALDAMKMYAPVIAFQDAGGIPEVLADNCGVVVPYGNLEECKNKINELLTNETYYREITMNAKKYVDILTPKNYVKQVLNILFNKKNVVKELPDLKVSVVIPNYNYERYIPLRLESILNQTVKPYEIIFLDDVSSDNSVKIARDILEKENIKYQIIENDCNNGCFRQWIKGVNVASGDIIWIAEADDLCKSTFIEELLPYFNDDQVNIAYAQSEVIYEDGKHSEWIYTEYTDTIHPTKWHSDYVNDGQSEIIDGLGIKNTIPNASGVLMRKSAFVGIEELLKEYDISGDWFAYVYLLKTGKIAFCSEVLNYHRRHQNSIIYKQEHDIKMFIELLRIKEYIASTFLIPENISEEFINHVKNEYIRLTGKTIADFESYDLLLQSQNRVEKLVNDSILQYHYLLNSKKMNIMFVIPDFEIGGGQTLVVRLANYFSKFHNVFLYNARPWLKEDRIINMISSKVKILSSDGTSEQLNKYLVDYRIDVVNDHIWWSDKIVYYAAKDLDIKVVLSMHGCYEALMKHHDWDPDFVKVVDKVLSRADQIIYATEKNTAIFDIVDVRHKAQKIYYGYELESIPKKNRELLNISKDSFVFGLVARGIKEKGFEEAINAFNMLKDCSNKVCDLVLIGNGEFIDSLKTKYEHENIHFVDNLKKPSEWIGWVKTFDCALLPTYFVSESLPNSVIEYLAYGKPVISTDIGDIRYMIDNENASAGILLELKDNVVDPSDLKDAMYTMMTNSVAYNNYKIGTEELFKQFDIKNFANNYYKTFVK